MMASPAVLVQICRPIVPRRRGGTADGFAGPEAVARRVGDGFRPNPRKYRPRSNMVPSPRIGWPQSRQAVNSQSIWAGSPDAANAFTAPRHIDRE